MAYDEHFAERVSSSLSQQGASFEAKKMMGGLIYMVNGKMCVGVDQDKGTGKDRLMARIGKEIYEAALLEKGAKKMDFTGRVMPGFVFIDPEGFDNDLDLDFWTQKALAFNRALTSGNVKAK